MPYVFAAPLMKFIIAYARLIHFEAVNKALKVKATVIVIAYHINGHSFFRSFQFANQCLY